jgi:DUF1707 SHOCT-like domain
MSVRRVRLVGGQIRPQARKVVVMTVGPAAGGETGRDRLEVSDAAREQVIDLLRTAFIQGRLTWDDLGSRTEQVLASRTHAELITITASIPAGRIAAPPLDAIPAPIWKRLNKKVTWGACAVIVPAALGAAFFTFYGGFIAVFLIAILAMALTAEPASR